MIKKILHGFLSIMRFIVCCCLIVLFLIRTFGEVSGGIYGVLNESGKAADSGLGRPAAKPAETSQNGISQTVKDAAYRLNTSVTDFGDHKIESNVSDPDIIAIAIHGGKIETGTTELAYALASRNDYSYYSYLGARITDNFHLHIDSDEFNEPAGLKMVSRSETTISVHGCAGFEEFTYVGGRDAELANKVKESLTKHGFAVLEAPEELAGLSPYNIVNKNKKSAGVQLELSQSLREKLLAADGIIMERYVTAVGEAVSNHSAETGQ